MLTNVYATRILWKVIFSNPKSDLENVNRSAVRARQLLTTKTPAKWLAFKTESQTKNCPTVNRKVQL